MKAKELIGMTLKEGLAYLKEQGFEDSVSIGAKNGSSYVFISPIHEETIFKCFNDYRDDIAFKFAHRYRLLTEYLNKGVTEDEEFVEMIDLAKKISEAANYLVSSKEYLDSYENPQDRKIVEAHIREDKKTLAIIVTGKEWGKYWFEDEYVKEFGGKKESSNA